MAWASGKPIILNIITDGWSYGLWSMQVLGARGKFPNCIYC